MEFFSNLWRTTESLRTLSSYLQWFSISLVFLGGALQVAKFIVDRREKDLVAITQVEKEKQQIERESRLVGKVSALEGDLLKRQTEINELKKKTEFVDPFEQPLRTGTATVEIIIRSSENVNTRFMDQGGYLAFGTGPDALLVMSSVDCIGKQLGKNQVLYRGVFNLDATDKSIGKPISHLTHAEYIQIGFKPMPANCTIIRGTAFCTFNNTVRVEVAVPPHQIPKDFILVGDVKKIFAEYTNQRK